MDEKGKRSGEWWKSSVRGCVLYRRGADCDASRVTYVACIGRRFDELAKDPLTPTPIGIQ